MISCLKEKDRNKTLHKYTYHVISCHIVLSQISTYDVVISYMYVACNAMNLFAV